jgi:hypothetical protein
MSDDDFPGPTIPANRRPVPWQSLPPDCPAPLHPTVPLEKAWRAAKEAFWWGAVFGGIVVGAGFFAGAAFGLDISGSTVTLEPSANPAAFADVVFVNNLSNDPGDDGAYTLAQDGFVVGVEFTWDANFIGMDRVVVTPPVGMTCLPADCTMVVIEGQVGRVTLFPYQGA